MPWIKTDHRRFIPSLVWQVAPQVEAFVASQPPGAKVIDLGAGGRNFSGNTLAVDLVPFDGTGLVADVLSLPFRDGSVDAVIATGLLEHVTDDRKLLAETARVLKPGGMTHYEVPFMQFYHDDPIDCRRTTQAGLARDLERVGLVVEKSGCHIGPTVTLLTLTAYYLALWCEGGGIVGKVASTLVFAGFSVLAWPLKFLDRLIAHKPNAHRLAYGVYCTARKPLG